MAAVVASGGATPVVDPNKEIDQEQIESQDKTGKAKKLSLDVW